MISSKITFLTVVAACFIATCSAQIAVLSPCQNVTLEQNFDLSSYAGKWFEYQRYFTFFQFGGKCVTAYYTPNGTDTITVRNYLVKENTGEVNIILGSATLVSEVGEGELSLDFPSVGQGKRAILMKAMYSIFNSFCSGSRLLGVGNRLQELLGRLVMLQQWQ
ncbi:Hypothetical predicted protein [Cloeon dipterum]|uniref:Lipocalin/cytosolic fatty-acid binding domain-containing protein n=1 Tax=Cloeon dipterum TaxID=197152 RepID=A0A8S1BRP8_9INSE|nr:Hypothetical predicted protein [Cloeon dipterum]